MSKRNTIIFGDDDSKLESNIDKIDKLILEKTKKADNKKVVEKKDDNFNNSALDNIKRIDALIEAKSRESNSIKDIDSKKLIKENTIVFGDDNNSSLKGKKHIKRGKINIKDGHSLDEDIDKTVELHKITGKPIIDDIVKNIDHNGKNSVKASSEDRVKNSDNIVDNKSNSDLTNNKKIDVMFVVIIMLLVIILLGIGFLVFLLSSW